MERDEVLRIIYQAEEELASCRFATTGFPDKAECLALVEVEGNPVHGKQGLSWRARHGTADPE